MIDSANGHLLPGDQPRPSLASLGCDEHPHINRGSYLVSLGEFTFVVDKFPFVPTELNNFNPSNGPYKVVGRSSNFISISKSIDGLLVLSLSLRNKDGSIIVKFDENGFEVGSDFFKRHPDKRTLIVTDLRGEEVLKVVYVNKRYLRLQGKLTLNGQLLFDTSTLQHWCAPSGLGIRLELFNQSPPK